MKYRSSYFRRAAIVSLCLMTFVGCTKTKVLLPASGTVRVGGKPAEGAMVIFHPVDIPDAATASGIVDADGVYSLVSGGAAGVEAGKYKVTITWPDASKAKPPKPGELSPAEDPPDLLKGRYSSLKNTTLEAEVDTGETELKPFDLELPK